MLNFRHRIKGQFYTNQAAMITAMVGVILITYNITLNQSLMSRYKEQLLDEKKTKTIGQGPPLLLGAAQKKSCRGVPLPDGDEMYMWHKYYSVVS